MEDQESVAQDLDLGTVAVGLVVAREDPPADPIDRLPLRNPYA